MMRMLGMMNQQNHKIPMMMISSRGMTQETRKSRLRKRRQVLPTVEKIQEYPLTQWSHQLHAQVREMMLPAKSLLRREKAAAAAQAAVMSLFVFQFSLGCYKIQDTHTNIYIYT